MLPFLKAKHQTGSAQILQKRRSDSGIESEIESEDSSPDEALESCARDLHSAMKSGDIKGMAAAMRAAFEILESEPHEEAGSDEPSPHSYDAQNELAGKESR